MSESEELSAQSSAYALHDVLDSVKNSGVQTLAQAWSTVLEAKFDSLEFGQRYGEVMCLWNDTFSQISALSPERTSKRMLTYAYAWWSAIVMPNAAWQNNTANPHDIINQSDLDQLASMGDLITAQLNGTSVVPLGSDLADLREQCEEWMVLLNESKEITDESFRSALQSQVIHLLWLIDNASLFGVSRVVYQGDQLSGTLLRASHMPEGKIRDREGFKHRIVALVTTLALIAGAVHDSDTIIGAAEHGISAIEKVVHEVGGDQSIQEHKGYQDDDQSAP